MKRIVSVHILIIIGTAVFAQNFIPDFGKSKPCNQNVNANILGFKEIPKKATFKIFTATEGVATGILVNRATGQDNIGFYFVTAAHVFENELDILPDHVYDFTFNYESPSGVNAGVPLSNRGLEPIPFQSTSTGDMGFQYLHKSKIRLVAYIKEKLQDFALLEILKPIPPYFNIAYVGWNPSSAFIPSIAPINSPSYFTIHHPEGDIKKINTSNITIGGQPINRTCRIGSKIIDLAFGWIWGRNFSTEVVCNYTETPILLVPNSTGITEDGSSGAGLVEKHSEKLIATLKGGTEQSGCSVFQRIDVYRKFRTSYYRQAVKTTLNPTNSFLTDQIGVGGKKIDCYTKLENLGGEYFAANAYQSNNKITLKSNSTAILKPNEKIRIHPGSDYAIYAKEFSMGFNTQLEFVPPQPNTNEVQGVFEIKMFANPCIQTREDDSYNSLSSTFMEKANNLRLPQYKPFNPQKYLNPSKGLIDLDNASDIQAYPNPSSDGNFTIRFMVDAKKEVNLSVVDILGKTVYSTPYNCIQGENYFPLDMSRKGLAAGIYFITLQDVAIKKMKKVIVE